MTSTAKTLAHLRDDIPLTREVAYFQTGSHGPPPDTVLAVVRAETEFDAHHALSSATAAAELNEREEAARDKLAALLNVSTEELAIAPNTSKAMESVMHGFDWRNGDEIVVSSLEHVSTAATCQALRDDHGVRVRSVEADQGDGAFLEQLESELGDRSRLVVISEVASPDGRRLPAKEAIAVAHNKGVPVVVDGAQSVGQFPVDVAALGCDFYVGSGHKWLLGPRGIGYVCVATDRIVDFRPHFRPDVSPWQEASTKPTPLTARTQLEVGTYSAAPIIGLGRAIDILDEIGLDTIEAHVSRLSARLREAASSLPGVEVLTPIDWARSAGITTLRFDGFEAPELKALVAKLGEDGVLVKFQWLTAPSDPTRVGMRISIASFNTEDEVRLLIDRLKAHHKA